MKGFHYAGVVKYLHINEKAGRIILRLFHSISPLTRKRFTISV